MHLLRANLAPEQILRILTIYWLASRPFHDWLFDCLTWLAFCFVLRAPSVYPAYSLWASFPLVTVDNTPSYVSPEQEWSSLPNSLSYRWIYCWMKSCLTIAGAWSRVVGRWNSDQILTANRIQKSASWLVKRRSPLPCKRCTALLSQSAASSYTELHKRLPTLQPKSAMGFTSNRTRSGLSIV